MYVPRKYMTATIIPAMENIEWSSEKGRKKTCELKEF